MFVISICLSFCLSFRGQVTFMFVISICLSFCLSFRGQVNFYVCHFYLSCGTVSMVTSVECCMLVAAACGTSCMRWWADMLS